MQFFIDDSVKSRLNDVKISLIHYTTIQVGASPQMIKGRLQLFQEALFLDLQEKQVSDFSGISEWRDIFKKTGYNPSRYRPSNEALYRRVQKQQFLQSHHSATDINNFFSMEYAIPIGIYDTSKIKGDTVTIAIGQEGETYSGLNGRDIHAEGLLVAKDEQGIFGSPYVDSVRTAVTESTTDALQIVFHQPSISDDNAKKLTESLAKMFTQVHGGDHKVTNYTI
ncbi:B3/4 domain-containing protein [Mangrovibacillus cuniculi]|uniref:B3/B4 tRNA-binding domain-containing protein n=1 Tax=Mangrovibacillus cuniculi TaxID=2593652 RepID=A0A7S8HEX1_9BACI|nr:phenylalanine--tRNA ligase beta subunit-related protein [Mangrovibacillus cuniculi]QPC45815.1 hypothetical protein G8O30_02005 [Mangrovibacillus cuniculi]